MSQLKSMPHSRLKKRKNLKICSRIFHEKQKDAETPKGAFRARKTFQKFGYTVLGHMGMLFPNLRDHLVTSGFVCYVKKGKMKRSFALT